MNPRFVTMFAVAALSGPVMAQQPIAAADLAKLEAKVPPQSWYPDGYYDVRMAAEGQMADYGRPASELLMEWDEGEKTYDVVDCGAEFVPPEDVDLFTARYSDTALEIARLRSELERMGYPLAVYQQPLLDYEKYLVERAAARPDSDFLPQPAEVVTEDYASGADVFEPDEAFGGEPAADMKLAEAIEANRLKLSPKKPRVIADGGCGAEGSETKTIVRTSPPAGEVMLVNAFAFKVCTRKKPDPWAKFACKWNEIETGKATFLDGRYVYQVRWPDGTVRRGTREIFPAIDTDTPEVVTFRKSGS